MTKLTKTQRERLIAIGMGTVVAMLALYFGVITGQKKDLVTASKKIADMKSKLSSADAEIRQAEQINTELNRNLEVLKAREVDFAPEHDPHFWMEETTAHFLLPAGDTQRYKSASITEIKSPDINDRGPLGAFPYKWAHFHITGQGMYYDFGKFIADFENHFGYFAIENLDIGVPSLRDNPETLLYTFDIVTPELSSASDTK